MTVCELLERLEARTTPDSAWALELIKRGPVAGIGGGCHGWLYAAARGWCLYRRRNGLTKEDIFTLLRAKADSYGRRVPDSEIEDAIESAIRDAEEPYDKSETTKRPKWPIPNYLSVALDDDGEVYFHPGMLGYWEELFAAANATFLWCPGEPMLVSVSWASETFPSQAGWLQEFASNVRRKISKEKGEALG